MTKKYEREISPWERTMHWSPYSTVGLVARVKGKLTVEMLRSAIDKVQLKHPLLNVKIRIDETNTPLFTSEGTGKIHIETITRKDDNTWIEVYEEACRKPFNFFNKLMLRIYLIQKENISDILIFAHHIICDGLSLAYLANDILEHLGDPNLEPRKTLAPLPITSKTIPKDQKLNPLISLIMKKINKKWDEEKVIFDYEDYLAIHEAYWDNYSHGSLPIELSRDQTKQLVANCKREQISVNTAIVSAFVRAQYIVLGQQADISKVAVGASLRKYLYPPIKEEMGFYAAAIMTDYKYKPKADFWENTRSFHKQITKQYTPKHFHRYALTFSHLTPGIIEAKNFKLLGELVSPENPRYKKLSEFSKRDDLVVSLLKRSNSESLDKTTVGTAVTNLTRMKFPEKYGDLILDRLQLQPGGAFPLIQVNLVVAAVTAADKLSLLVEFSKEKLDPEIVQEINQIAIRLLLDDF